MSRAFGKIFLAAAFSLGLGSGALAEVIESGPGGFQVRQVASLEAPLPAVRAALLNVGAWWSSDHTYSGNAANLSMDLTSGCFCEKLKDGFVRHMTVVYADSKTLRLWGGLGPLQTTGAAGHLAFNLAENGSGGTRLVMTYDVGGFARGGLGPVWAAPVDEVLGLQVLRLKSYAESGAKAGGPTPGH